MRPMKACYAPENLNKLPYPIFSSEKLDGIRCVIKDGIALSNTLKPIRNKYIQSILGDPRFNGLDGELIVNDPTAKDCMRVTNSGVMSADGEPAFNYFVFDYWDRPGIQYRTVLEDNLINIPDSPFITPLPQRVCRNTAELEAHELSALDAGYEGLIVRRQDGAYKFGKSTVKEGYLMKLKRFHQEEAIIIGYEPLYHNANDPELNGLGYTKRSTAQNGKIALNMLGSLTVKGMYQDRLVQFDVGSGFTKDERITLWQAPQELIGKIITYKFFPSGSKDKPRHPVFISFRDPTDIGG